ncbi:unnamed protein product [Hymenolepis diminuta]|uniref:Uncharacterized protein n=1 Tax=Hymenolepis diminuta TaxID=6216 RepID=A0A564ZB56_HYMDI|nr:unnamed protein product [Hymenolepis diminuta]
MKEVFDQNFTLFNVRFNSLKLVFGHDEDLYGFAGVVSFYCDKYNVDNLKKRTVRMSYFHFSTSNKALVTIKISSVKTNRGNFNVKLQEVDKEGVKMVNLRRDSDDIPMHLIHKMSASVPQSAQFVVHPNPSVEQKSSSCLCCRG